MLVGTCVFRLACLHIKDALFVHRTGARLRGSGRRNAGSTSIWSEAQAEAPSAGERTLEQAFKQCVSGGPACSNRVFERRVSGGRALEQALKQRVIRGERVRGAAKGGLRHWATCKGGPDTGHPPPNSACMHKKH